MPQQPIYSSSSMKSPSEKGGTRTRALPPPPTLSQESQAIEGYCTPMVNRKVGVPLSSVDRSDSGISSSIGSSGQVKTKGFAIPKSGRGSRLNLPPPPTHIFRKYFLSVQHSYPGLGGSEYWTNWVFKWSKYVWVANSPDL